MQADLIAQIEPKHVIPMHYRDEKAGFIFQRTETRLNMRFVTVTAGKDVTLNLQNAKGHIIWESGNEDVAEVNNGVVTGIDSGETTITAQIEGNEAVYDCIVYVWPQGSYAFSARGKQSDVTVTMAFSDGSIQSIDIDASGETAGYGERAASVLKESILSEQTADVDTVSGATKTSKAILKAAGSCIQAARDDGLFQ